MKDPFLMLVYDGGGLNYPPIYSEKFAAGFDFKANIKEPLLLNSREARSIPTGCFLIGTEELNAYLRIAPKSSLALKGIDVLAGVVDSSYREEILVILINHSNTPLEILPGQKIAQGIVEARFHMNGVEIADVTRTGGFGSTGK